MASTSSSAKYRFIPKPIEQQLASYQPGEVLDYYQFGWKRNARGEKPISWRLPGFVLLAIGLVSTYYSGQIAYETMQMSGVIGPAPLLIIALPVTVLVIGWAAVFHPAPFCLIACTNALIYAKKKRITVIPWPEIAWYEQKTIHNSLGYTFHKWTIRTHKRKKIRWKVAERAMENLEAIIFDHIRCL